MGLALCAGRHGHYSGQQIHHPRRETLLATAAFITHSRDVGVAGIAPGRDLVSGQVGVLGTQLEEVVE